MKDSLFIDTPCGCFVPFERAEIDSFLELFPDEALLKSMNKAVELEEFEIALIYKEELVKRGKV